MSKIIAVASWKVGTGKTTTAAALSSCLAELGYKTLCVDFGDETNNLDLAMGMADPVFHEKIKTSARQTRIIDSCRKHPKISKLSFLSGLPDSDFDDLDIVDVKPVFDILRREFDYCIIDTPAGAGAGFRLAHASADMSIIVINPETQTIKDSQKIAGAIYDTEVAELSFLVNRVIAKDFEQMRPSIDEAIASSGAHLIGLIPEDEAVLEAIQRNIPLILYNSPPAAYHFLDAARRITGESIPWRKLVSSRNASAGDLPDRDPAERDELTDEMKEYYGDPETWAKSTLSQDDAAEADLVLIYEVKPGLYIHAEMIRQRMWLHDVLDDKGIPYQIVFVGYWASRRKFVEAQNIYVEKKHAERVRYLIKDYRSTRNIIQTDLEEHNKIVSFDDGVPQKNCPSCGKEIDFDYYTCPHCKTKI